MNSKNKIIIFDLWQTLVDSVLKPSDWFDGLFKFNKTISKNDFLKILFKSDLYSKDVSLKEGLKSLLSNLGIFNKENMKIVTSLWREMIQKSFLINGSEAVLVALKNRGCRFCLLTNIDKYGYENFPFKNFLDFFDHKFLSYRNGLIKPDIRCWETIKNYYNTNYENMIMIGNSIKDDIAPSKSLGLSTILININNKDRIYDEIYTKLINK